MLKTELFTEKQQQLAQLARALSHPARIAILAYLAQSSSCISGDISNEIPLSRTTVSQHLTELKKLGFISGTVEGVKVNYCLDNARLQQIKSELDVFFNSLLANPNPQCNL
ncbi:MAG: metalloregulator ArsR/SmtB family transcription factor [Bacteroidetes bacterium]|nr:metalloregulator ArsR/SmtB family transcription factor [Bacteroidota bacterium]MBU1580290.1 metalloregulator ArsR/SmtB family transcription factor [Bacteroidota bacterium]MBU2465974.1 metalloregulator ArsR/SmtB family transcription factor [Bacteroidota bacterium]MBU2556550.1 metalloregulator ArsR/SmtB family transcription factor [Bacteroidota bacterium]